MKWLRFWIIAWGLLLPLGPSSMVIAQDELIELVTGLLTDSDKEVRALAFDQIRKEVKGEAATRKFAELLTKLPADTQIGLLSALADRGDAAAATSVRKLIAESKDDGVRVAAVKALGPLGRTEDLKLLVELMSAESEQLRDAARDSLVRLPNEASTGMIAALKDSPAATKIALLPIFSARRSREAIPVILETASNDDPKVRQGAIAILAELGDAENVPQLIPLVLKAAAGRERDTIEKAIATICQRNPNPQERATVLLESLKPLNAADKIVILSTIGRVGGTNALQEVDTALQSANSELHDAGIRALCNWPDGTVVSRLLRIARTDPNADQRKLAFQALVRISPLADERDNRRRLDTLRTVWVMCSSDAERNQVLDRAKAIRDVATLRFVLPFLEQPIFAQQACLTVVELAHHSSLRESNKEEFLAALDQVQKISKDATVLDRAERYKTGQTWVRPKSAD